MISIHWLLFRTSDRVSSDISDAGENGPSVKKILQQKERGELGPECHFKNFLEACKSLQETVSCHVGPPRRKRSKR